MNRLVLLFLTLMITATAVVQGTAALAVLHDGSTAHADLATDRDGDHDDNPSQQHIHAGSGVTLPAVPAESIPVVIAPNRFHPTPFDAAIPKPYLKQPDPPPAV